MSSKLLNAAETWEKVYRAFEEINFTAYDYDAVQKSLIDYLKVNYPENFNDYTESSMVIPIIQLFAYVAELLAYRVDMSIHEGLITTAQRKQSILRLAKLVSYTAARNLPLRGLVKINSISISEDLRDSQGNSLANRVIKWNDANNTLWREQFFAAINKITTQRFGMPYKSFQIDDTVFQQYEIRNVLESETERSSFRNGVLKLKVEINGEELQFELVPADVDDHGVFERSPNVDSYFTILYGDDGYGDSSDTTGYLMYLKQGQLTKVTQTFSTDLPNRSVNVEIPNINDVDVWVQEVDDQGSIIAEWENVPNIAGVNIAFNTVENSKKYEIETLEDDQIRLVFGDGDFAEIPKGIFNIWVRQSTSGGLTVSKNQIAEQSTTFLYTSTTGKQESCTLTYSLTGALQNSSESETIEHIRAAAPAVFYSQNRMVNGEDYNSYPLRDSTILRAKAVNRTFAGQPKYIPWNDASGQYQNIKVFGNDLRMYYDLSAESKISQTSSRSLIDEVIEPLLADPKIYNLIVYAFYTSASPLNKAFIRPRTRFIEDVTQLVDDAPIQEKTIIQGALDRHWYGEPGSTVLLDADLSEDSALPKSIYAVVNEDTDHRIYDSNLKMVTRDPDTGVYTLVPTPFGLSGVQETVIRQKRFAIGFNPDRSFASTLRINAANTNPLLIPDSDSITALDVSQSSAEVETFTIEITDVDGTFTVYGTKGGYYASGKIGEEYDNGKISFLIGFPVSATNTSVILGDAFIIDVALVSTTYTPTLYKKNLTGLFTLIEESSLPDDAELQPFDAEDPTNSWIMIIERNDSIGGDVDYWRVTTRAFNLVVESPTTKFWYNSDLSLVDPDTKLKVFDQVRILKSNLNVGRTAAIGADQVYSVISDVKYPTGETNFNALVISPTDALGVFASGDGAPLNSIDFLRFIGETDYVYFSKDAATGKLTPIETTSFLQSLTYVNDESGDYVRKLGRDSLDFMWQHFTPNNHLIDPSPTNINDIYVLTRGYYARMQNYLRGIEPAEPAPPTTLELRNTYRNLISSKMLSDTVVFHSAKIKLLFGRQAVSQLRATFKIVRASGAKLTGDQIRARALGTINAYFQIENWDFGQDFYASELRAMIHSDLASEISSVELVPDYPTNYFGDLMHIKCAPDEIFLSCAQLENIEIVESIDRVVLKQKQ